MGESKVFNKIATLKVKNGTYQKDGVEKNRYQEVGVLLSSPHASQLLIKLHATAVSEPKLVSVFLDDGVTLNLEKAEKQPETNDEIDFENIPF